MTTTMAKPSKLTENAEGLVEVAWDPITRIVGSLGNYTKIDFKQKVVSECHSNVLDLPRLFDLHEG